MYMACRSVHAKQIIYLSPVLHRRVRYPEQTGIYRVIPPIPRGTWVAIISMTLQVISRDTATRLTVHY